MNLIMLMKSESREVAKDFLHKVARANTHTHPPQRGECSPWEHTTPSRAGWRGAPAPRAMVVRAFSPPPGLEVPSTSGRGGGGRGGLRTPQGLKTAAGLLRSAGGRDGALGRALRAGEGGASRRPFPAGSACGPGAGSSPRGNPGSGPSLRPSLIGGH